MASPEALQGLLMQLDPAYYTQDRVRTLSVNDMLYAIKQLGAEDAVNLMGALETTIVALLSVRGEEDPRAVVTPLSGFGGGGSDLDGFTQNDAGGEHSGNTALGVDAMASYEVGVADYNTAVGFQALYNVTVGDYNTGVGGFALFDLTTGIENTVVGYGAGGNISSGSGNTVMGDGAGWQLSTVSQTTAIGKNALWTLTTGIGNTGVGYSAGGAAGSTGEGNTAVGWGAFGRLLGGGGNGSHCTVVGSDALSQGESPQDVTAIGYRALRTHLSNLPSTAVGYEALVVQQTGEYNTAVGTRAMGSNVSGDRNVAVGDQALESSGGDDNTGIGWRALEEPAANGAFATLTGLRQTAVGSGTGQASATQRNDITALGYRALCGADDTVALGSGAQALHANSVALGKGVVTTAVNQVEVGPNHIEITELGADPAAPAADGARLYTKDNGAGKTQLCVRFASGAVQVIATEP